MNIRVKLLFLLSFVAILTGCGSQTMGDVTTGTWKYNIVQEEITKEAEKLEYDKLDDNIEGVFEFFDDNVVQISDSGMEYTVQGHYLTSENSLVISYEEEGVYGIRGTQRKLEFTAESIRNKNIKGSVRVDSDSELWGSETYIGSFSLDKE